MGEFKFLICQAARYASMAIYYRNLGASSDVDEPREHFYFEESERFNELSIESYHRALAKRKISASAKKHYAARIYIGNGPAVCGYYSSIEGAKRVLREIERETDEGYIFKQIIDTSNGKCVWEEQ